jgi:hypothetical protein
MIAQATCTAQTRKPHLEDACDVLLPLLRRSLIPLGYVPQSAYGDDVLCANARSTAQRNQIQPTITTSDFNCQSTPLAGVNSEWAKLCSCVAAHPDSLGVWLGKCLAKLGVAPSR